MNAIWEQATVCPCINPDTNQPDFNCTLCSGTGFIYFQPMAIKVLTTSLPGTPENEIIGYREPGTAYCTPTSDIVMGYQDHLYFPDFNVKFSQLVKFDESGKSSRLIKPCTKIVTLTDGKSFYKYGTDYVISDADNKYLLWLNPSNKPLPTQQMSCLYFTHPVYAVMEAMHELRATWVTFQKPADTFVELPKQYLVKRLDFIYTGTPVNVDAMWEVAKEEGMDTVDTSSVDGSNNVCSVCPIFSGCKYQCTNAKNVGSCTVYQSNKR